MPADEKEMIKKCMAIKRFFFLPIFFFLLVLLSIWELRAEIRNAAFSCSFHLSSPPPYEDMYIFNAYRAKTPDRNEKFVLYEIFIETKQIEAIYKKKTMCRQRSCEERK
jgi:hypothetical protein